MSDLSRTEAQLRADYVRIFREELARLETSGILALSAEQREAVTQHHDALLAGYAQSFDIDRDRHAKQLSLGMRIASLLGALALAASVFFLFNQYWGLFPTTVQVVLLIVAALGSFAARQPSRRAWLVREHDGPAYQASLARAGREVERAAALVNANPGIGERQERLRSARRAAESEARFATRLFVVDAGQDENALRAQYPDRQRYVILGGRIRVYVHGGRGDRRLAAFVSGIDVEALRVPHASRAIVEPFSNTSNHEPRFAATVKLGRRHEPWIADLARLE